MPKSSLIKARVSEDMKDAVARIAAARGESEAVIVREALKTLVVRESAEEIKRPAAPQQVSYLKPKRKPKP